MSTNRLSRQEAKERTRVELLDAAAEVFARRGYEGASVQEIAEAAGRTTGAIYTHFPTKEALFLSLLAERNAQARARAEATIQDGSGVIDRFADWFADDSDQPDGWDLLIIEFWLFAARNPERTTEYRSQLVRGRDYLAGLLSGLYEQEGRPPPLEPGQLATIIYALRDGLRQQRIVDPDLPTRDLFAYALRRITTPHTHDN